MMIKSRTICLLLRQASVFTCLWCQLNYALRAGNVQAHIIPLVVMSKNVTDKKLKSSACGCVPSGLGQKMSKHISRLEPFMCK